MASRTRARVSRLTCELEFSTREIVPMPTEAAWATSRIVVFLGTASMAVTAFVAWGLAQFGRDPRPLFTAVSLAHQNLEGIHSLVGESALLATSQETDAR